MTQRVDNIKQVGVLQDFGTPFSSLFINLENKALYLFVKINSYDLKNPEYAVTNVSATEIEKYMDDSLGLNDIFRDKTSFIAVISDNNILIKENRNNKKILFNDSLNHFDSDFCEDDVWLETFLQRIKNNKPLEIA